MRHHLDLIAELHCWTLLDVGGQKLLLPDGSHCIVGAISNVTSLLAKACLCFENSVVHLLILFPFCFGEE